MGDTDERLEAIKAEGRARRARRSRRNTAVLGAAFCVVAVAAVAGPWSTSEPGESGDRQEMAARDSERECRNSVLSSCGELRWDPEPAANQPVAITVESPSTASAGEPVELAVRWSDPDAPRISLWVCWGDAECEPPPEPCVEDSAAGPWTPPDAAASEGLRRADHIYSTPGRYEVTAIVRTSAWPDGSCLTPLGDPFGDVVTETVEVEVR